MTRISRFHWRLTDRSGQTMTEYALILGAIAIVCFAGYKLLGVDVQTFISVVTSDF